MSYKKSTSEIARTIDEINDTSDDDSEETPKNSIDPDDNNDYEEKELFSFKHKVIREKKKIDQHDIEELTQNCILIPQKYYSKLRINNNIRILTIRNDIIFATINGVFQGNGYPYLSIKVRNKYTAKFVNIPLAFHKIQRIYKQISADASAEIAILTDSIILLRGEVEEIKKENNTFKLVLKNVMGRMH